MARKERLCTCCASGKGWNTICCCLCKKVRREIQGVADGENNSGTDRTRNRSVASLLFSSESDSAVHMPKLSLSMFCSSLRKSNYLDEWWNICELVLVIMFWVWMVTVGTYNSIKKEAAKGIARAISVGATQPDQTPFVDLDHVAIHATWAHDLMGALFIGISIHSLKILSRVPFGVGSKVTAITSIFVHPDILPFYLVLIILLVSFAFGFFFAYGDEVSDFRHPTPSFKHMFLMTLMGENIPGGDKMEGSNLEFYFISVTML